MVSSQSPISRVVAERNGGPSLKTILLHFVKGMERMVLFEESNQDFFTIEAALKLVEM